MHELKVNSLYVTLCNYFCQFYSLPFTGNLATKNESDTLLFRNPTGSGIEQEIWDWEIGTVGNITIIWRMYYNPTVTTNGTTETPVNTNTSSTNTSSLNVYSLPTISSRGTLVDEAVVTIGTLRVRQDFGFAIYPDADMLVTLEASASNNDFSLVGRWAEDND